MRPLQVFLCHASQDKPDVLRLHRNLKRRNVKPWLDQIDLLPGENWEIEIPNALFSSDVILVCLSKNSVDKEGYVQKEITFALDKALEKPDGTIFIVPVKLEECELPKKLSRFQAVELFRKDGFTRLLLGLNKRVRELGDEVSPIILEETRQRTPKPMKLETPANKPKEELKNISYSPEIKPPVEFLPKKKETQPEPKKQQPVQSKPMPINVRPFIIGGIVITTLLCFIFGANYLINNLPINETPTSIASPSRTSRPAISTATNIPITPTITLPPTPGLGSTMISEKDGMVLVYVPAGEFTMGSDNNSDEQPIHQVTLDAYWIDQTEVTNAMYADCVDANQCDPPSSTQSYSRSGYFGNSEFDNYPVLYVSWNDAVAYCEYVDRRLPTEAEWEKAARGTDASIYPWGDADPKDNLLNFNGNVGDTTEVGSYPTGASIYGAFDMAGNVWEWVNDWYDASYYQNSPSLNPSGPDSGQYRVLRGGSWYFSNVSVRSAFRLSINPSVTRDDIGFRCSRSP